MDRRVAGRPDQDLQVEPPVPEDDVGEVAEPGFVLKPVEPASLGGVSQNVLNVDPVENPFRPHQIHRNRRKLAFVVSRASPPRVQLVSELTKVIHRNLLGAAFCRSGWTQFMGLRAAR